VLRVPVEFKPAEVVEFITKCTTLLPGDTLRTLHERLRETFPRHALVFRSVNHELNGEIGHGLRALGYRAIFSRQVYLPDPPTGAPRQKQSVQKGSRECHIPKPNAVSPLQARSDMIRQVLRRAIDKVEQDRNHSYMRGTVGASSHAAWLTSGVTCLLAVRFAENGQRPVGAVERSRNEAAVQRAAPLDRPRPVAVHIRAVGQGGSSPLLAR